MDKKDLKIGFHAPLHKLDTESQTFGCRANNPDICSNNGLTVCAFVSPDGICKKPSKAWKKQFAKLKGQGKETSDTIQQTMKL